MAHTHFLGIASILIFLMFWRSARLSNNLKFLDSGYLHRPRPREVSGLDGAILTILLVFVLADVVVLFVIAFVVTLHFTIFGCTRTVL